MASCSSLSSICSASLHSRAIVDAPLWQSLARSRRSAPPLATQLGPCQAARLASRLAATSRQPTAARHLATSSATARAGSTEPLSPCPRPALPVPRSKRDSRSCSVHPFLRTFRQAHTASPQGWLAASGAAVPRTAFDHPENPTGLQDPNPEEEALDLADTDLDALHGREGRQKAATSRAAKTGGNGPRLRPQPQQTTVSPPPPPPLGSFESLSDQQLIEVLQTQSSQEYQDVRARLPLPINRIEAYVALRQRRPDLLGGVSDWHVAALFRNAAFAGYAGLVRLLIDDLLGTHFLTGTTQTGSGLLRAEAGTARRAAGLKALLLAGNQHGMLRERGLAIEVFHLLLHDVRSLSASHESDATGADATGSGGPDHGGLSLPSGFPAGEARLLIRTITALGLPDLVETLQALQSYLAKTTPDFPSSEEGSSLIRFYLSPNVRMQRAALDVVMSMRETNAVSHDTVLQAHDEGEAWLEHVRARLGVEEQADNPSAKTTEIALEITLRIIGLKALLVRHPAGDLLTRQMFEELMATLRSADGDQLGRSYGSPTAIAARQFRTVSLYILSQHGAEAVRNAYALLQRCDRHVLAAMEAEDVEHFCHVAFVEREPEVAVGGFLAIVKAKSTSLSATDVNPYRRLDLCKLVRPRTLLRILEAINKSGQIVVTRSLLRGLGLLPLTEQSLTRLDQLFPLGERADLVTIFANAGLKDAALELYQRWSRFEFPEGQKLLSRRTTRFYGFHRKGYASPRPIPLDSNFVAATSSCMLAMVRMLTKDQTFKLAGQAFASDPAVRQSADSALRELELARFVVEAFKESRPASSWSHYDLNSLAHAFFQLRDSVGAFDALGNLLHLRRVPDEIDVTVLLSGLMHLNPDKAVELLLIHGAEPNTEPLSTPQPPTSSGKLGRQSKRVNTDTSQVNATFRATTIMVSALVSKAVILRRFDLVRRLLRFATEQGLTYDLGLRRFKALMSREVLGPLELANSLESLVRSGWRPDATLLDYVAREILLKGSVTFKEVPIKDSKSGGKHGHTDTTDAPRMRLKNRASKRLALESALRISHLCYKELGIVNLGTIDALLKRMQSEAQSIFPPSIDKVVEHEKKVWTMERRHEQARKRIQELDRLVGSLRWTLLFDRGKDLLQGLPLWKSGSGRDGKLAPADLGDVADASKLMREGYRKYSRRRRPEMVEALSRATRDDTAAVADQLDEPSQEMEALPTSSERQQQPRRPNVLPLKLFRHLMETYLRLHDQQGAAEVAAWMRDEAHTDVARTTEEQEAFVETVRGMLQGNGQEGIEAGEAEASPERQRTVLEMLAGRREVSRTKSWWIPR